MSYHSYHLPTSAMNLAYKRVSLGFYIFTIVINEPKQIMMKIIPKKNFKIYDPDFSPFMATFLNLLWFFSSGSS